MRAPIATPSAPITTTTMPGSPRAPIQDGPNTSHMIAAMMTTGPTTGDRLTLGNVPL